DGYPMGVAAQVVQDFVGRRKGALGIDHPLLVEQGANQVKESRGLGKRGSATWELKLIFDEGLLKESEELAAENERERLDREEEGLAGRYPAPEIEGQRSTGNEAVQMEVIAQRLVPGMQDTDETEQAMEVGAAKLEQSLRDSFEQDIAEHLLVHQQEWVEFVWQREDEMEVAHWQQVGLAVLEPLGFGQ